jgi:uncharacterized repeat protein (TIGR01451 family)
MGKGKKKLMSEKTRLELERKVQGFGRNLRGIKHSEKRWLRLLPVLLLLLFFTVLPAVLIVYAQSPALELTKDFGGATGITVESGEVFTYNISYRCASITENCVAAVVTDTLPAGIEYINAIGPVSDVDYRL